MSKCIKLVIFFKPSIKYYVLTSDGLTMMVPELILYEDLNEDYDHLLFSSDLLCIIAG